MEYFKLYSIAYEKKEYGNEYKLDWIQFTIKDFPVACSDPEYVLRMFYKIVSIEPEEITASKGFNGYKSMIEMPCGIKIMYNGTENMGVNICIPSKAINDSHFTTSIEEIQKRLEKHRMLYKWTRLDFCIDTKEVPFAWFYNKYIADEYRCKYRRESIRQNVNANCEGTLYFGKRGGKTMFRIYNKGLEQGVDGIWTRVEMETREEACEQLLKAYKEGRTAEYFNGHLDFVKEVKSNVSRCETDETYLKVIKGNGEKVKVHNVENKDNTLEWLEKQVFPTLKAIVKEYGWDVIHNGVKESKISNRQARERFNIQLVKGENESFYVNTLNGVIISKEVVKEYQQMALEDIDGSIQQKYKQLKAVVNK